MIVKCYAKVNLYLEVLNKRKDGYHNLRTVFERINLHDKITLTSRTDKTIEIVSSHKQIPRDKSNLAYQSAYLLQKALKVKRGVKIGIIKDIPVGAGLGGGSSDAAGVLMGLNKLWGLKLKQEELASLAEEIGSDVAFFVYNCPFAQGDGCGEKIKPLTGFEKIKLWHILVVPKIHVSTPFIYKKWDEFLPSKGKDRQGLTKPELGVKLLYLALRENCLSSSGEALFNSLESVTTRLYPEVSSVKDALFQAGVKSILMSGSGPAVFGIVQSRKEALAITARLRGQRKSWQVFVTKTA